MTFGFIGIGTMASAMIEGLAASGLPPADLILSPRGAAQVARLSERFPGLTRAGSNQEVVDRATTVILAIRPQIAHSVVRDLRFRPGQRVLSLVAATQIEALRDWIQLDLPIHRAVPLPSVAERACVTPIFPPDPATEALFARLGTALPCQSLAEFDLLAAGSTVMGTYFGLLATIQSWLAAKGLPEAAGRAYLAGLFANLGAVARQSPLDFTTLRHDHSTPGGLNEQVHRDFCAAGGPEALTGALDAVLARIRGASPREPR